VDVVDRVVGLEDEFYNFLFGLLDNFLHLSGRGTESTSGHCLTLAY
jgi:hypothetical protein